MMTVKNHIDYLLCQRPVWIGAIIGLTMVVCISGCGSNIPVRTDIPGPVVNPPIGTQSPAAEKPASKTKTKKSNRIEEQLRAEFELWEGTEHKLGGMDRNGVDCSGFVKIVYKKLFNITLPRTTKTQSATGRFVKRSQLRPGDLVFFKPPFAPRHVGIYLGNHEFVHASNSSGVIISEISPTYWSKYYWTARRVLPEHKK